MTLPLLTSCGGGNAHHCADGAEIPLKYAENLKMTDYGDFIKADFRNPWDTSKVLQSFLLVPRDKPVPATLPPGTVVKVPLEKSVVYTAVHCNLIEELGAIDAIAGICDAQYIKDSVVKHRHDNGVIADCGASTAPNIERILMLGPDAILLSAYENSNDHNKVAQLGIPVVDCIDYMETSPLGRAEWMRFFGRLYGKGEQADSLFTETERAYKAVKERAASVEERPVVMTEKIYAGTWDVPGATSTVGVFIDDAGGTNPFAEYRRSGSVKLAPEEVLFKAKDADIWLVKYYQDAPLTLGQLEADNAMYAQFRPFITGNVYGCNTAETSYFEDAAFHPHWILSEFFSLLHPEVAHDSIADNHHYYTRLQK